VGQGAHGRLAHVERHEALAPPEIEELLGRAQRRSPGSGAAPGGALPRASAAGQIADRGCIRSSRSDGCPRTAPQSHLGNSSEPGFQQNQPPHPTSCLCPSHAQLHHQTVQMVLLRASRDSWVSAGVRNKSKWQHSA